MEYQELVQSLLLTQNSGEKMRSLLELLLLLLKLYENYPVEEELVLELKGDEVGIRLSEKSKKWRESNFYYNKDKRFAILINSYLLLAKLHRIGQKIKVNDFKDRVADMDKIFYALLNRDQNNKTIYSGEVNRFMKSKGWFRKCFDFDGEYVKPLYVPRKIIVYGRKITPSDYVVKEDELNRLLEKIE